MTHHHTTSSSPREDSGMTDIDRLEMLAKAATPGPWTVEDRDGLLSPTGSALVRGAHGYEGYFSLDEDAAYCAAANPAAILALIAEVRALREDRARLDWLDRMNAGLNHHYGTKYQWKVILSTNITRLMTGRQWAGYVGDIDLNDAQCGEGSFDSCRKAIDDARGTK